MSIPQKDRRQEAPDKRLLEAVLDYALGVLWNIEEDKLEFQVHMKEKLLPRTGMLSSLILIYGPLGLAALVMLERRRIIQTLCHQNLHWDEQNPENIVRQCATWKSNLLILEDMKVERYFKATKSSKIKNAVCIIFFSI